MSKDDFYVGQILYAQSIKVQFTPGGKIYSADVKPMIVELVGRKYVYTDSRFKFDKISMTGEDPYSGSLLRVYLTEKDCDNELIRRKRLDKVSSYFSTLNAKSDTLSSDQLKSIMDIIGIAD